MSDNAKTYHWNVSEDTEMKQVLKQAQKTSATIFMVAASILPSHKMLISRHRFS